MEREVKGETPNGSIQKQGQRNVVRPVPLPPIKTVQAEIEALIKEKNRLYVAYRGQKQTTQELQTVRDNIRHTLSMRPKKQRDAER